MKGQIRVLDKDNIAWKGAGRLYYWRVMERTDTLMLGDGDDREVFFIKEEEKIHDAAVRLRDITGWDYQY